MSEANNAEGRSDSKPHREGEAIASPIERGEAIASPIERARRQQALHRYVTTIKRGYHGQRVREITSGRARRLSLVAEPGEARRSFASTISRQIKNPVACITADNRH